MNFRIVEGERDFSDIYEDLKNDFLKNEENQQTLRRKYDLSVNQIRKLRQQMIDEGVVLPKTYFGNKPKEDRYIYTNNRDGVFMIVKNIKGKSRHYGTYDNIENARVVRDALLKHNWDKEKVQKVMIAKATQGSSTFLKHKLRGQ